jgi:hypothetical protein
MTCNTWLRDSSGREIAERPVIFRSRLHKCQKSSAPDQGGDFHGFDFLVGYDGKVATEMIGAKTEWMRARQAAR